MSGAGAPRTNASLNQNQPDPGHRIRHGSDAQGSTQFDEPCSTRSKSKSRSRSRSRSRSSKPSGPHAAESILVPSPPSSHGSFRQPSDGKRDSTSPLRILTDLSSTVPVAPKTCGRESQHPPSAAAGPSPIALNHKASAAAVTLPFPLSRTPSVKAAFANYSGSLGNCSSTISSPAITALGDMTPLPSPLLSSDSPGPWRILNAASTSPPPPSTRSRLPARSDTSCSISTNDESVDVEDPMSSPTRRKQYGGLKENGSPPLPHSSRQATQSNRTRHSRDRSISEYIPETPSLKRNVVVSCSHVATKPASEAQESLMRREMNFAESRGITAAVIQPPTPPPSESSKDSVDGARSKDGDSEWFQAHGRHDRKRRRWRSIGFLGQGTFSRVMLASSQIAPRDHAQEQPVGITSPMVADETKRRKLVAVKVCEHGPRGGASEERIEMSLKRELEIMQDIHHPSLVNLKAWSIEPTRAILVLSYCPGGDLFAMASTNTRLFAPSLLRRVFAELVGAVKYLHERNIVHRDIKLENVLVNLTPPELADASVDWSTYPTSVVTLADLGLSRRIADNEKLETRCGSEDYAAPEVIMGQPYDGRATDAWSLGVLLYALLERRLPFDPHPGMGDAHRMRSRTSHRIARVEWRWVEYAGEDGEHEASEAKFRERGLLGAMEITEGLLKRARSRWGIDKAAGRPWVSDAIRVDGGIKFRDEDEGEEVEQAIALG
ncbi:uncharacterized protein UV8b_05936 [Ustilaginoidea virens]|uniref:Protein kinase domain-containing protein n=1 Tax=Ustilaginoidea virens TaxID=1159556 RepID=A0A8E5MIL8_USTVR|nr:uncharacterized protein UV8b_05936 [Ustilaginoidea virens]QUC21693.1 hypothetical protein UV8b_05936 [Ustilaginoidea virens]